MFSIQENTLKNRLYVSLGGVKVNDTNAVVNAMVKKSSKLQKGFTVLLDLTKFRPTSEIVTHQVCMGLEFMEEQGMGKAVRVFQSLETKMDMDVFCQSPGSEFQTASSILEAEKALDWWAAEQKSKSGNKGKGFRTPKADDQFSGALSGPFTG